MTARPRTPPSQDPIFVGGVGWVRVGWGRMFMGACQVAAGLEPVWWSLLERHTAANRARKRRTYETGAACGAEPVPVFTGTGSNPVVVISFDILTFQLGPYHHARSCAWGLDTCHCLRQGFGAVGGVLTGDRGGRSSPHTTRCHHCEPPGGGWGVLGFWLVAVAGWCRLGGEVHCRHTARCWRPSLPVRPLPVCCLWFV
jgi:hypothetical protein